MLRKATNQISEHFLLFMIFLALIALMRLGVGNAGAIGVIGLALCLVGFSYRPGRVDLVILASFTAYLIVLMLSAYHAGEDSSVSFASTQSIFLVLYLLIKCLSRDELGMLKKLSLLLVGFIAACGIVEFVYKGLIGRPTRLYGMVNSPNAMGILMVVGWCMLLVYTETQETHPLIQRLEPLVVVALSLTLSLGSFVAMAVGLLLVVLYLRKERGFVRTAAWILARTSLGFGVGLLLYITARKTAIPWFCVVLLVYIAALTFFWPKVREFLSIYFPMDYLLTVGGAAAAVLAVVLRPSSIATFSERLGMMRSGMRYVFTDPLLGIGPYQWRLLNLAEDDTYFNTWHIHNIPLHLAVEAGLVAFLLLTVVTLRILKRKKTGRPCFAAYLTHNLVDTSFFFVGITSLVMIGTVDFEEEGRQLDIRVFRGLLGLLALLFLYNVYHAFLAG